VPLSLEPAFPPGCSSWPSWLDEASPRHRLEAEAAAEALYPTAAAFLASIQPDWGGLAVDDTPRGPLPPLVSLEELACLGGDREAKDERLKTIASWSNFLCLK
jgi:hypothetical protein